LRKLRTPPRSWHDASAPGLLSPARSAIISQMLIYARKSIVLEMRFTIVLFWHYITLDEHAHTLDGLHQKQSFLT
jgi:hypothetical protein